MIDLSADLGEGSPEEDQIWPLITSANVACGGHTGDEPSMREAAQLARQYRVRFGAHPSYPDRPNFGRKSLDLPPNILRAALIAQLTALHAIHPLHHVKPHGALYNDAHKNRALADVIIDAMQSLDPALAIVAPDHSQMAAAARAAGMNVIREAFADRRYEPDGSLTPRSIPGSTLTIEEAAAQAALLVAEGVAIARDGTRIPIAFDTLCIHADMEHAIERLRAVRSRIDAAPIVDTETASPDADDVVPLGSEVAARVVKPRSPKRTAFVCGDADLRAPQFRIRIHRVAAWLRSQGYDADLVFPGQTAGYDVLVFFREVTADEHTRMQEAQRNGQRVLLDLDFPYYRPMVQTADTVVCCSHALAARLRTIAREVVVIEDAVETDPKTNCEYRERRRLVAGWMGMTCNEWHAEKLRPLIEAAGHQLLTIHGGANADVPWDPQTWPAALASCDIAVAPQDVEGRPSKSNNKVTTAMALGLPVIAAPLDAYRRIIRHGENGYLASTDDDWRSALEALCDRDTRERIGRSGKATACAWSIDAIGAQWRSLLVEKEPVVHPIQTNDAPSRLRTPAPG